MTTAGKTPTEMSFSSENIDMKRKRSKIIPGAAICDVASGDFRKKRQKLQNQAASTMTEKEKLRYPTSEYRLLLVADEVFGQAPRKTTATSFRISPLIEKIREQFNHNGGFTTDDVNTICDRLHYLQNCASQEVSSPLVVVREKKIKKAVIALSQHIDFEQTTKAGFLRRFKKENNFYLTENVERKIEEFLDKQAPQHQNKKDSTSPAETEKDRELKTQFQALVRGNDPDELPVNVFRAYQETSEAEPLSEETKTFVKSYVKGAKKKIRRTHNEGDDESDGEARPNSKEELKQSLRSLEIQWKTADDQVRNRFDDLSKSINKLCTSNTDSNRLLIQVLRAENRKLKKKNQELLRKTNDRDG